jgi:hypothetical protein
VCRPGAHAGADLTQWSIAKWWFNGQFFDDIQSLIAAWNNDSGGLRSTFKLLRPGARGVLRPWAHAAAARRRLGQCQAALRAAEGPLSAYRCTIVLQRPHGCGRALAPQTAHAHKHTRTHARTHVGGSAKLYSNFEARPTKRGERQPVGPVAFEPYGRRFSISENNRVSWLGWQLYVGYLPHYGPRYMDVRFRGERVAYEISMQEALACGCACFVVACACAPLHTCTRCAVPC